MFMYLRFKFAGRFPSVCACVWPELVTEVCAEGLVFIRVMWALSVSSTINFSNITFGLTVHMGSNSVHTHWLYQYCVLYLAWWWFSEPKHVTVIFNFNIDYQNMLCYLLNILLYYCKTQWDGSHQNKDAPQLKTPWATAHMHDHHTSRITNC